MACEVSTSRRGPRNVLNSSHVHVWVADECERKRYRKALQDMTMAEKRICGDWSGVKICVGVSGLARQRCYISRAYPEGQHVLQIDDDIYTLLTSFRTGWRTKRKAASPGTLEKLISSATELMAAHGASIWGHCRGLVCHSTTAYIHIEQ